MQTYYSPSETNFQEKKKSKEGFTCHVGFDGKKQNQTKKVSCLKIQFKTGKFTLGVKHS